MDLRCCGLAIFLALGGCEGEGPESRFELRVTRVSTSAGPTARWPRLDAGKNVLLSWLEESGNGEYELRMATRQATRFSEPTVVASGRNWFVNWADYPSVVALDEENLAAHWLEKIDATSYAYGIRIVCSIDGGSSWGAPFWLHRDVSPTEHGFATIVPRGDHFAAVWLDGRDMPDGGGMTLRSSTFDASGLRSKEVVLDEGVCECCATDAAEVGGELLAVYRDRGDDELRDIWVARTEHGRWGAARNLHEDGWITPG